jgi:pimeloyl-ACP methyl ester carboxylesterase
MRELLGRLEAGELRVPMLLLYARRDPLVPPSVGSELARRVPAATLRWLSECSHFAHVDCPDAVVQHALEFLRR